MLTDRFFASYGLVQVLGVYSIQSPSFFFLYLVGQLLIVVLMVVDYQTLIKSNDMVASVECRSSGEINKEFVFDITVKPVRALLRNPKSLVWISPIFETLDAMGESVPLSLEKGEEGSQFKGKLKAFADQLGYEKLKKVSLRVVSRSGLWVREITSPIESVHFRIHPGFSNQGMNKYSEQLLRQKLLFQGTRHLTHGRSADQFHSVRAYQFPDEFRHIDQKKTAKYGKLMTRIYDEYHAQHLIIGLDLGRSMMGRVDRSQKHDFYLSSSLNLIQEAINEGDDVSFFAFSDQLHKVIPRTKQIGAFRSLYTGEARLRPREVESDYGLIPRAVGQISGQRSIVIIFTDLTKPSIQSELVKSLRLVATKNLVIALGLQEQVYFLKDRIFKVDAKNIGDEDYSGVLYSYWLQNQFRGFTEKMSKVGAGAMQFSDEDWMEMTSYVYGQLRDSMRA